MSHLVIQPTGAQRPHATRLAALAFAGVLMLAAAVPVSAAKPTPTPAPTPEDPARSGDIAAAMDSMYLDGATQDEIDAMLLSDFGLVALGEEEPGVALLSSQNSDVDLKTPAVYWDTQQAKYVAYAWFYWKSCGQNYPCWKKDKNLFDGEKMGGYDGFAISLEKLVSRRTSYFHTYSYSISCRIDYPIPWDADDSGVAYRNQDGYFCDDQVAGYNWDRGLIEYSFNLRSGCPRGDYEIHTKLAHTWGNSGTSRISVNLGVISVAWSGGSDHWQGVNPVAKHWYPCGA
jgi:hypothetical protein